MSYKAIFEIFLQIHDFVNIDLPNQGLFRIRTSLYQEQNMQKTYGLPFQFMEDNKKPTSNSKKIYHSQQVKPPFFYSKIGIIKYADETVNLEDQIRFKLQIQSFPRLCSQNVFIQFQLIFQQCYYSSSIADFQGKIMQTKKFKLQNLEQGILNYCEGQFGGNYPAKFSFTVFACLSNFTFGKYKLPQEFLAVSKQDNQGNIKNYIAKPAHQVKQKQIQRSKIKTFQQFMKWIQKYYNQKIPDPLQYFYGAYVKNLRYYFYLAQQKINQNSIIVRKILLKVPKDFLELPSKLGYNKSLQAQTQVFQKQFRKYMTDYEPKKSSQNILAQINAIYFDIYMFLLQVQKQFQLGQLMRKKMKSEYNTYIKQRYGQRVFKSVVKSDNLAVTSRQNKKIAKKMREKQKKIKTVVYPIQDISFVESKDVLQFLFYEITDPKKITIKMASESHIIPSQAQVMKLSSKDKQNQFNIFEAQTSINPVQALKKVVEQKIEQQSSLQKQLQQNDNKQIQIIEKSMKQQQQYNAKNKQSIQKTEQQNQGQHQSNTINAKQIQNNENVQQNLSHQKYEKDSQISQKSLAEPNLDQPELRSSTFSGISEINIKNTSNNCQQTNSGTNKYGNLQLQIELPKLKYKQKDMLIVMCHGFQGSAYDMSLILRGLKQLIPEASYLLSRCNEESTQGDIDEMGRKLSQEVQQYIRNYMSKQTVIINFVGHSMGGIIARAGVKYLSLTNQYADFNQYGFFCSLSSPHLGYLNGVDGMIKAGLWAILKFKNILSLQQLTMADNKQLRQSFMYKLSKEGSLKRFRKIILLSSFQDSYVTWHSARISVHNNGKHKKSLLTQIQQEMVSNILGSQPIHRIDVNFNIKTNNLDSFIGRTAHINLIVQQSLFKMISTTIPDLFDLQSP